MLETPPTVKPRPQRRWILVLLAGALASTLLLIWLAGSARTIALVRDANLVFVACIVLFQALRYVAMTISTSVVLGVVGVRVPPVELFQVTVAGSAANRTFVGGAGGLAVRLAFFVNRGVHSGTFAGVEGIEDVVSLGVVALMFIGGLGFVVANGAASGFRWDVIGIFVLGTLLLAVAVVAFVRRRAWVERVADWIAFGVNRLFGKVLRRNLYDAERVRGGVNDFYRTLALARRAPGRVFISFLCALARLGCDWIALYFAFRAIGHEPALGTVLLIFVVSSSVATIAAVPGQIGVMETTLAFMSTALGISPPVAVSATLLYRVISFLLPVPFGYAFAWNLERRGMI